MTISRLGLPSKGPIIAVLGAQWGDEAKGKIVDWLASVWADIIVRGTGGANAGHTICVNGKSNVFHLMPSAIQSGKPCYIGNGVTFDPWIMLDEMAKLDQEGVDYSNLKIAFNAHLVTPLHIILDKARESLAGKGKIGTTGKGIGPTNTAHTARIGLKVVDLLNPDQLLTKLNRAFKAHEAELAAMQTIVQKVMLEDSFLKQFCKDGAIDVTAIHRCYVEFGKQLRPFIADTDALVQQAVADGLKVLLEGAQGGLLSIKHGIYPMVTTSDSTLAGLAAGSGLRESQVTHTYSVVKAPFMSKVGGGNFPTRLGLATDNVLFRAFDINSPSPHVQGAAIRHIGKEVGATTGRDRDVGWLDLVLLRYALQYGGDELILTKVDVMDTCREIKLCTHYIYKGPDYDLGDRVLVNGQHVDDLPLGDDWLLGHMEPQYEEFPGWLTPTTEMRSADELPTALLDIIRFIEGAVHRKVAVVSVGPDRDQTIVL